MCFITECLVYAVTRLLKHFKHFFILIITEVLIEVRPVTVDVQYQWYTIILKYVTRLKSGILNTLFTRVFIYRVIK
jgi:hypothetical protein